MAAKRRSELVAGTFVLMFLAVIVGVVMWLGAANLFSPARQRAVFFVPESAPSPGLAVGSSVEIGGKEIGRIAEIRLDLAAGRTLYIAEIVHDNVTIYSDAKAHVVAGLVGQGSLAVTDRGAEARGLACEASPAEITGGLEQAISSISTAADNLKEITEALRNQLSEAQVQAIFAQVRAIMDHLHHATADVRAIVADARPKVEQTLTAVRSTAVQIESYSKKDIAQMLENLRKANTKILRIADDFATVSEQTKQIVLVNRDSIDEIIDNMTQVSVDLKATAKNVRRNPWRLLYEPDEKELHSQNIYDAAAAFSSGAEQLDQALTRLTGLVKARGEALPAGDPELVKIRKQVEEVFSKFSKAEQTLWQELTR